MTRKNETSARGGAQGGSGQQVLGPAGKKKDPNEMIEDLFKVGFISMCDVCPEYDASFVNCLTGNHQLTQAAKDAGAEEVDPDSLTKKKSTLAAFKVSDGT